MSRKSDIGCECRAGPRKGRQYNEQQKCSQPGGVRVERLEVRG